MDLAGVPVRVDTEDWLAEDLPSVWAVDGPRLRWELVTAAADPAEFTNDLTI